MHFLKNIILQVGIICGFAYIITRILDWYNPYMDFSGHMWYLLIGVFGSVLLLTILPEQTRGSMETPRNRKCKIGSGSRK